MRASKCCCERYFSILQLISLSVCAPFSVFFSLAPASCVCLSLCVCAWHRSQAIGVTCVAFSLSLPINLADSRLFESAFLEQRWCVCSCPGLHVTHASCVCVCGLRVCVCGMRRRYTLSSRSLIQSLQPSSFLPSFFLGSVLLSATSTAPFSVSSRVFHHFSLRQSIATNDLLLPLLPLPLKLIVK